MVDVGTIWAIGKDLKSYLDRPQLIVDNIRPENFRFLTDNFDSHYCLKLTGLIILEKNQ